MSSMVMKYMKWVSKMQYRMQGLNAGSTFSPEKLRKASDASMKALHPEKGVTFRAVQLGIMPGEVAEGKTVDESCVVMYIHGGGLVAGNAQTSRYFASTLVRATGYRVYTCSYRLAPEHQSPAMQDDCISGYADILRRHPNTPIVVLGESGGAFLTLTTTLLAKERGLRLPVCVATYSLPAIWDGSINRSKNASTDISLSEKALDQLIDVVCPNKAKRSEWLTSPLYGDYNGFPPIYLAWSEDEILAADSEALLPILDRAGVEHKTHATPDSFHAFPTLGYMLPEAKAVVLETAAFIKAHIG